MSPLEKLLWAEMGPLVAIIVIVLVSLYDYFNPRRGGAL